MNHGHESIPGTSILRFVDVLVGDLEVRRKHDSANPRVGQGDLEIPFMLAESIAERFETTTDRPR